MKRIVADSSPLIALSRINQLELLSQLFDAVLIPRAVAEELFPMGKQKKGIALLQAAGWIITQDLKDPSFIGAVSPGLDLGERAAIALAREQELALIIDDAAGREEAARLGIAVLGTAGALLEAKIQGLIPAVKPLLEALRHEGFRLSAQVFQKIIHEAKEA